MNSFFTNKVFMVRPSNFGLNKQTMETNSFQPSVEINTPAQISKAAIIEFDEAVRKIQSFGVEVQVFQDSMEPLKPDAVFPNNWISTHATKQVIVYPMLTQNRKAEVRKDIIEALNGQSLIDLRTEENAVLEGTGSVVIDHEAQVIYFCHSDRTQSEMVDKLAKILNFKVCGFHSTDHQNNLIYHTNVVMFVMQGFVGIGLETIKDQSEKDNLVQTIQASGKEVLDLSYYQITQFAGNMLQVKSKLNDLVLVCSETAWKSLDKTQKEMIEKETKVCPISIPTIEFYGGGSARCMIAENFI